MIRFLPSSEENNILLRSIHVVIFQQENFVDPVVLKSGKLDKYTNRASKRLLNDEVLLPSDLMLVSANSPRWLDLMRLTYAFEQV